MKFFATSEAYKTVGLKLTRAQNIIEKKVIETTLDKTYGTGISYWGYISIANPKEVYDAGLFREVKKYKKSEKELELRLRINYNELLEATENKVYQLICGSILRSIDIAENELKIKDFDFPAFRSDLNNLFKEERWI